MSKKKSISFSLITFVITLIITTAIAAFYLISTSNSRKERASFIAYSIADRIEAEINNREYITRVYEIQIRGNNGEISEDEFNTVSEALFDDYLDIIDISLARDGIVSNVYPKESSLDVGTSFFSDSRFGVYADYSKMSQVAVIIAPAVLNDGKESIIITRPIFLNDGSFW